jgi:ankyrin repeat protein
MSHNIDLWMIKLNTYLQGCGKPATLPESTFSDVNACNSDGDNGLHCVVRWDDLSAAKALLDAGIDINKAGDLGYTPLHVACMRGNVEMVRLLIDRGANLFALSEGDAPFATARSPDTTKYLTCWPL